jgi:hypothetical protein
MCVDQSANLCMPMDLRPSDAPRIVISVFIKSLAHLIKAGKIDEA